MPARTMSSHKEHECRTETVSSPHARAIMKSVGLNRGTETQPTTCRLVHMGPVPDGPGGVPTKSNGRKQEAHRATYHKGNWRPAAGAITEVSVLGGLEVKPHPCEQRSMTTGADVCQQEPCQATHKRSMTTGADVATRNRAKPHTNTA